jgi:hypothetical protein
MLAMLFPAGVSGTEVAITIDDLPTHRPLPPGITRLAVADHIIEVLRRHGLARSPRALKRARPGSREVRAL